MKPTHPLKMNLRILLFAALGAMLVEQTALTEPAPANENAPRPTAQEVRSPGAIPQLRIAVDPSVELVSLLFRLAGNPEYNKGRVQSYTADVDKQFKAFGDHRAVQLARRLHNTRGIGFDACMNLAVLLTDPYKPAIKIPLQPWPEFLDRRWTADSARNFAAAAGQFVKDTSYREFVERHRTLYETTELRLRELMEKEAHLEWFQDYFGERPHASFTLIAGLLNGPCNYGPRCRDAAGKEELFCVLGVSRTDSRGLPAFRRDVMDTVIHEFCHSYANAIIDAHESELAGAAAKLFQSVAGQMRRQAYGNGQTMLRESLVRACVIRYLRHYDGVEAARREIEEQNQRGFLWMADLSDFLAQYEAQRNRYPTLGAFSPNLVAFFKHYAAKPAHLSQQR